LGAVRTSAPFSLFTNNGFIQELNCCGGRLFSNELRHESQKEISCMVALLKGSFDKFYIFAFYIA
jgi:hypothetical protein